MSLDLVEQEESLRAEARRLLTSVGLADLLGRYGEVRPAGSYTLRLMVWRDLDVYLLSDDLPVATVFEIGRGMADLLDPVRMSFRNEHLAQTPGLPRGLYWGVHLADEPHGPWKIDIWIVPPEEGHRLLVVQEEIAQRLTDEARLTILSIKAECWQHPGYRRSFSAVDIYRAVLDAHVTDMEGFRQYLEHERQVTLEA
jgi:hypothetical protein